MDFSQSGEYAELAIFSHSAEVRFNSRTGTPHEAETSENVVPLRCMRASKKFLRRSGCGLA